MLLSALPLPGVKDSLGTVLILHDLSFIERRSVDTRFYLARLLAFVGLVATAVTLLVARLTLRRWARSMCAMLKPEGRDVGQQASDMAEMGPVVGEIRQLLRDLDMSRSTAEGIRVEWSPATLRRVLDNELPGAEVIVVSNREPYIHNAEPDGTISVQRPASGLVTALEPVTRACAGTWIAHGSGSATDGWSTARTVSPCRRMIRPIPCVGYD